MTKKSKSKKSFMDQVRDNEMSRRKPANYTYFNATDFIINDEYVLLTPFSDIHAGNEDLKQSELEKTVEKEYDNGSILALNGDLIESKTRSRKGDGIFTQWNPMKQMDYIMDLFKPFAKDGRIIAMTNGNHEDAITLETGVDVTAIMAKEFNIPYLKNGGFMAVKCGDELYNLYMTHGSSNSTLPYTKIKACLNLGTFIQGVDAYLYGHVHDKQDHTQEVYVPNNRSRSIEVKKIHYVLTGHYLNYINSYAQQKSMRPSATGTPELFLYSDKHEIDVKL